MNRRQVFFATTVLPMSLSANAGVMDWFNGVAAGSTLPEFDTEYLGAAPATNGKLLLIDFWATWCAPCREEFPHLNTLNTALTSKGLVVLGLTQESASVARSFLPKVNIQYPIGAGGTKKLQKLLGIKALPYAILVDRNNKIIWRGQASGMSEKELEQLLIRAA